MAGRGTGLFTFSASIAADGNTDVVQKAWDAEVERIQNDGVSEDEVRRALTQARASALVGGGGGGRGGGGPGGGMQSVLGRANALTQNAIFYNDPGRVNTQLSKIEAVTAADVKRVANKYLKKDARVILITNPEVDLGLEYMSEQGNVIGILSGKVGN